MGFLTASYGVVLWLWYAGKMIISEMINIFNLIFLQDSALKKGNSWPLAFLVVYESAYKAIMVSNTENLHSWGIMSTEVEGGVSGPTGIWN